MIAWPTSMKGSTALLWLIPVLFAPAVGSFLGLVAVRVPQGEPWASGRSRCRSCGQGLEIRDLVPLASWLASGGTCRHCGANLGPFYPVMELAAVCVAVWSAAIMPGWTAYAGCVLGWTLLLLSAIDARHFVLPDEITLPLAGAGLLYFGVLVPGVFLDHLLGLGLGFGVLFLVAMAYRHSRGRDGLGLGDAKLMGALGAWLGWAGLPSVLLYAGLGGLGWCVYRRMTGEAMNPATRIPFGPFLSLGGWLVWLYGPLGLI